ncbi:Mga-like protein with HTH domain [Enterococcus faecalis]
MDIFKLLDEDQRYQLFIIRFLDVTKDEYITISKIVEITGQSKFKVINFIHALNYDIRKFKENCKIAIQDDLIITENVDLTIIKLLQIDYFKTSQTFLLLIYLLEEGGTIEKYATDNFLSTSKAYATRRQLINFLKSLGIKVKKNRLVGEEFAIRNILGTLIFEALNGYYSPFSNEITIFVKKIRELLTYFYNLRLTPTQVKKMEVLIAISLIRCKNGNTINNSFITDLDKFFRDIKNEIYHISNYIFVDQNTLMNEFSYNSMFLFTEGVLEKEFNDKFNLSYFEELDNNSGRISEKIIHKLEDSYNTKFSIEIQKFYTQRLKQANRRKSIFSFETSSFATNNQVQSVRELYPIYSEIVWQVIEEEYIDVSKDDLSRYFYDYLFILIDVIPPAKVERPIYVCVDFSQGIEYTNFIIKQIEGFKDLNLIIEYRLTSHTNILISNCVWANFNGTQIVWKNPPMPSDWEYFGNAVIRAKRKLLYEDISFNKGEGEMK